MTQYPFMPFAGHLETLKGSDLAGLKEVAQGWYIEYSEGVPSASHVAKQLSAFANGSGGWLFIGIKGQQEGSMAASSFPGIAVEGIEEGLKQLRGGASKYVTPEVWFETQLIEGPVPELDLPGGRSIIVAGIPEGLNPPYIHCSGRVYRRPAAGSEPESELERAALDALRCRARATQQRLAEFLAFDPPRIAEHHGHGPVRVYVYLLNDPLVAGEPAGLAYDHFVNAMRSDLPAGSITADFNNLFTTSDGYIARHAAANDALSEGLSFRWWMNANVRASIPVDVFDVSDFPLHSDPRRSDFVRMLRSEALADARIADFSEFLSLLAAVIEKYLQLRKTLGLTRNFWGKMRFCDARRAVPFINLRQYIENIKIHGFPVIQDNDFYAPEGLSTGDLIALSPGEYGGIQRQSVLLALRLAVKALRAVGIDFDRFIKDDPAGFLRDLAESMSFVVEEPPDQE